MHETYLQGIGDNCRIMVDFDNTYKFVSCRSMFPIHEKISKCTVLNKHKLEKGSLIILNGCILHLVRKQYSRKNTNKYGQMIIMNIHSVLYCRLILLYSPMLQMAD